MREAGVPTTDFEIFEDAEAARRYVKSLKRPCVVKADGLALGKGVTVCTDEDAALTAIGEAMDQRRFGAAGARIVIEEVARGEELSFFALCDGVDAVALGCAQDHKAVFDNDRGPNTGGMGAYTPLPRYGAGFEARIMRRSGAAHARGDGGARGAVSRRDVCRPYGRRRSLQCPRI